MMDNKEADAIDPEVLKHQIENIIKSCNGDHENLLETYISDGLDGLKTLVERHTDKLDTYVMDIVPHLHTLHHGYQFRHRKILSALLSAGSRKELSLAVLEQLELVPCFHALALLLPLLDLSEDRTLTMMDETLYYAVCHSGVCEQCAEDCPDFAEEKSPEEAILCCIKNVTLSDKTAWMLPGFQHIILHVVQENRCCFQRRPDLRSQLFDLLPHFQLSFSHILQRRRPGPQFDPSALLVCSVFLETECHHGNTQRWLPHVYKMSWLFTNVVPWIVMILNEECLNDEAFIVHLSLCALLYFSKQTFNIPSKIVSKLRIVFSNLISVAVNNTELQNRRNATTCIKSFSDKLRTSDRLKIIESFISHENASVSGLFLDSYRSIISDPGTDLTHHKVLKIANMAVELDKMCDVLLVSDRIMAALSILQVIGIRKLPLLQDTVASYMSDLGDQVKEDKVSRYLSDVSEMVKVRQTELQHQIKDISSRASGTALVPATMEVQGEVVTEPSAAEQLESLDLARCRLDLILYNLARCRKCFNL